MIKVITYGTYDLLHHGHVRLLERAKALGDYLIVGVTSDDFDKARGKINVQQPLIERIEAIRATGLADEIIVEEYEGQKIDDIKRFGIDIFTVGSDWNGKFDYLKEFCKVVYLDRTEGVSSSEIRSERRNIRLGLVGDSPVLEKYRRESSFVNGLEVAAIYTQEPSFVRCAGENGIGVATSFDDLLDKVDCVYLVSHPEEHYSQIKRALLQKKHVLCESPVAIKKEQCQELFTLARENNCVLMDAIKTAYSTAYYRLLLLVKSGCIGSIVSVDSTCTSLQYYSKIKERGIEKEQNSMTAWGPTALLPIFQILGTDYSSCSMDSLYIKGSKSFDLFTKVNFSYSNAVATMKIGKGVKSEGDLVVSGTKGYVYVPAPWWKTDYFEIRFENQENNKRYFYQLDGEGIRYELLAFIKSIGKNRNYSYVGHTITEAIAQIIEQFDTKRNVREIGLA